MADKSNYNKRATGTKYEHVAGRFLMDKGYEIIQYNYYGPHGEIDIIALDGDYIVFCEVKYRNKGHRYSSLKAVDRKKQQRIINCASFYLLKNRLKDIPCRFDVIGIEGNELIHIKNAFSLGSTKYGNRNQI